MEIWKSVIGYEGIYEISSLGRLKVLLKERKYRDYQERILKTHPDKDGYFRTVLTDKNKNRKNIIIHRIVAETFIKNKLKKPCVNHIDGVKTNNNINNLEWCTVSENNKHAIKNGLSGQAPGEKHHMSKLKEKDVLIIRELYSKKKYTQKVISDMFSISQTQISRIVNQKRWNFGK